MKEQLQKIIYEWVKQNFGESEANDPSWSIEALAEELDKHFYELYQQQELESLKDDVRNYARDNYKLTEQQIYNVADRIRNSDWYCSIDPEDMTHYIEQELKEGE